MLFPFSVMDLLLALTEDAVHEVIWTDALLDEWEEVIVGDHRRSAESAASVTAAIRAFFPRARWNASQLAADDYLQGLDRRAFSTEAGRLLGDLNALHPFRYGNGRTQRGFLQLLAR